MLDRKYLNKMAKALLAGAVDGATNCYGVDEKDAFMSVCESVQMTEGARMDRIDSSVPAFLVRLNDNVVAGVAYFGKTNNYIATLQCI